MPGLSFESFSIWVNFLIFAIGAGVIWYAGTKLERYGDAISRQTGLGKAFVGMLLLAAATSLPELATTLTATLSGNITLAVSNILGGVVTQTAVLALADVLVGRGALTRFTPGFVLLIQGVGLILLLTIVPMAAAMGDMASITLNLAGMEYRIALIPLSLLVMFLVVMYLSYRYEEYPRWRRVPDDGAEDVQAIDDSAEEEEPEDIPKKGSYKPFFYFALFGLLVLVAGFVITRTAEALATQTGLGSSFIGATLLAISTSLPEISTTTTAIRHDNYSMAISNIFGSNAFDVSLLAIVSLVSGGAYLFQDSLNFSMFAVALGIFMTGVYLWGLLEWEDKTFLRMGWDSTAVVVLYLLGSVALYQLS